MQCPVRSVHPDLMDIAVAVSSNSIDGSVPLTENENMLCLLHLDDWTNRSKRSLLHRHYSRGSCAGRTSLVVIARTPRAKLL